MSTTEQQLWEKLSSAAAMPYGRTQIATVEDVIRHADAQDFADVRYAARILATQAYTYGAEPAKAFVTFAWCLATYDSGKADPRYDQDLHWQFKWMVSAMTRFPEVPLDQTFTVLDDMERRYRLAGHALNPVHQHRELVARHVGDADTAVEQYRLWCAAPRGDMADCAGCEPTSKVMHLSWLHRDEEAIAVAVPVLDGSLDCVEQPQAILTSLLMPYLRTGRLVEAADAHRRAYRAIQANRAELAMVAAHVAFCARSGNHARGLELVERHLGWLAEPPTPWADMRFSAAAALALRRVAEAGHGDTLVRRPQADDVTVADLRDELADRARGLARRFDERNGTTAVSGQVAETLTAEPVVEHLPLSGLARRAPAPEPARIDLPDSPAELVALVRAESRLGNQNAVEAAWRRFDEVCPDPEPALLAPRLSERAADLADTDPEGAAQVMVRAAELYGQVGDHVRRLAARSRIGMLWCQAGRVDAGLAEVVANTEALMAVGDDRDRADAQLRLGVAYQMADRLDDALATLGDATELAERAGDAATSGGVAMALAQMYGAMGGEHYQTALDHVGRAVAAYSTLGPTGALRRAQLLTGQIHGASAQLDEAYVVLGEAAKAEEPGVRGHALHIQGKAALDLGRVEDACEHFTGAVEALSLTPFPTAYAKVDLAAASLHVNRPDTAADVLEEALAELTRAGDEEEASRARFLLARAYRALGQHDQALTLLEQVVERCAEGGNPGGVGQMRTMAGDILDELDRDKLAAEQYTLAAEAWHEAERPLDELVTRRRAAVSWRWAEELDRCLSALTTAETLSATLDEAEDPNLAWEKAMLAYDAARILADVGRPKDAVSRAADAVTRFRSLAATTEATFATLLHGRLLADLGRPAEAENLLTTALRELPPDATEPREQVEALLSTIRS